MVMHWQYVSICRGGRSILEKIREAGIDPEKYISFYALRGHDKIHNKVDDNMSENKSTKSTKSKKSDSTPINKGKQNSERLSVDNSNNSNNNSGAPLDRNLSNTSQISHDHLEVEIPIKLEQSEESFENATGSGSKESPIQHPLEDSFSDEKVDRFSEGRIGGEPAIPFGMEQMDLKKTYITEEIYIHSKLMIVDDQYVICGSGRKLIKFKLYNIYIFLWFNIPCIKY